MKYDLYDFDGTIYDGDSGIDIILFALKKYPKIFWILIISCFKYFFKIIDKKTFKGYMFSFVKYIDNMDDFLDEFWIKNEYKIKSFWKNKKNHKKDIIISASGYFWLKPIADKYKVADLIATNIDINTGKIIGNNCHGEEKVKIFYSKYKDAVIDKMYTDSSNDLPLIKEAKQGFMIKKNIIMPYYDYKPSILKKIIRYLLKIYNNREIFCYLVAGFLTVLVNLISKWALLFTVLNSKNAFELQLSVIISWIVAVLFAYFINRFYVFNSKNDKIVLELVNFFSSRIITLIIEIILMWFLITLLKLDQIIIITILIQVVIIILNYILSKLFVFKKR